jgi:hypothetical protein
VSIIGVWIVGRQDSLEIRGKNVPDFPSSSGKEPEYFGKVLSYSNHMVHILLENCANLRKLTGIQWAI